MSDGAAMRKLEYTGASHYFSLPQRPPLVLYEDAGGDTPEVDKTFDCVGYPWNQKYESPRGTPSCGPAGAT
jgi:hypothetical protein